ncbi:MAG TPA: glycoside hydrolase family 6 protein, partial [Actinoplanes sp.]
MRPALIRGLTAAAAVSLVSGVGIAVATNASAAAGCSVSYSVNQWSTGFTGTVNVTNLGDPITSGWTVAWDFPGNQRVTQGWSATVTQSGTRVTAVGPSWSASVATNASVNFGFNGEYSGTNTAPSSFSLNGVACTGGTSTPTTVPTTAPSTTPTTAPSTGTPTTAPTTGTPSAKVDNPYAGAKGYVNPEWKAKADAEAGGSRISNTPTAVWLDRIAAIEGTTDSSSNGSMGLADHLDAALAQGAGYIQIVIYNLPGRDCAALASNGELGPDEIGRYKTEYIDAIAAIEGNAKYAALRIVNIVEIDSLPNLVTNTGSSAGATAACDTMKANGNYVAGIGYALQKL